MRRISLNEQISAAPRAVALGVFDGLHIGHRAVISAACGVRHTAATAPYLTSCVFSLTDVPKAHPRLTDDAEIDRVCETLGVDEWLSVPFGNVCHLSPAQFVTDILQNRLHAKIVCCGKNYRFGHGGEGNADTLAALCAPLGITVRVIPSVAVDGVPVSTTRILSALETGDISTVRRLSGRPYRIVQTVSHGNHLGRTWGFPTINQVLPDTALPRFGVYASLAVADGVCHRAVTNVGVHPSVRGGSPHPLAETWIENFDADVYGETVTVELVRFLRDEQRFDSREQLLAQIEADRTAAFAHLSGNDGGPVRAVLFDFDDTLQNRRAAFLAATRELLARYMPYVNDEERDERARTMLEENNGGYVNYTQYFDSMFTRWEWQGVDSPEALHDEYLYCFPSHTTLFADAADTLRALRERGYITGVITNGSPLLQNRKLDVSGLRPLLDVTVVSGDEGVHKPNPELFRRVAMRLGLAPQQCVYVGDHPVNDMQGAREAGMRTVFLNAGDFAPPDNIPVANTPTDVLPLIEL